MSDLVKKLRDNETSTCGPHAKQLMNKAADEIERLRVALEREQAYTAHLLGECPPDCKNCGE